MKTKSSAALEMVKIVARGLRSLKERVVFFGGAATSLFMTDPALPHIRTTLNVDVTLIARGQKASGKIPQIAVIPTEAEDLGYVAAIPGGFVAKPRRLY